MLCGICLLALCMLVTAAEWNRNVIWLTFFPYRWHLYISLFYHHSFCITVSYLSVDLYAVFG